MLVCLATIFAKFLVFWPPWRQNIISMNIEFQKPATGIYGIIYKCLESLWEAVRICHQASYIRQWVLGIGSRTAKRSRLVHWYLCSPWVQRVFNYLRHFVLSDWKRYFMIKLSYSNILINFFVCFKLWLFA